MVSQNIMAHHTLLLRWGNNKFARVAQIRFSSPLNSLWKFQLQLKKVKIASVIIEYSNDSIMSLSRIHSQIKFSKEMRNWDFKNIWINVSHPFLSNQCLQLTYISVNQNGIALQDIPCRNITKQHNMLCCSKGWCNAFWQIQDSSNIHNFILINLSMNAIKEKQKNLYKIKIRS